MSIIQSSAFCQAPHQYYNPPKNFRISRKVILITPIIHFHRLGPLGRVGLVFTMSVCLYHVPTCSPDMFTRLMDPTRGAFKMRKCSGLDSWTVRLVDPTRGPELWTWLVHPTHGTDSWSLKSEELFQIGLVDYPCVGGARLVDCSHVEP